jgi:hypothetical protein
MAPLGVMIAPGLRFSTSSQGKDGWRHCSDYGALNARTVPNVYPFRHIADVAQRAGRRISTIHFVKAYQQFPIHPDIVKTSITTFGLFEFKYVFLGLQNTA